MAIKQNAIGVNEHFLSFMCGVESDPDLGLLSESEDERFDGDFYFELVWGKLLVVDFYSFVWSVSYQL